MTDLRTYVFKLKPRMAQAARMETMRHMHGQLYNALLQERMDCYRLCVDQVTGKGKSLTYYDQCKSLTALRNDPEIGPEWAALSSGSMEATAQRVDRAFKAFFQRARAGLGYQSGFPRYKRGEDYPGYSFKCHGSGWNIKWQDSAARQVRRKREGFLDDSSRPRNGSIYIKGVQGRIRFLGRLRAKPDNIKTCTLTWRGGDWWLSLVVDKVPKLSPTGVAEGEIQFNLIDSFVCVKITTGLCEPGPEATVFTVVNGRITPQGSRLLVSDVGPSKGGAERRGPGGHERKPEPPNRAGEGVGSSQIGGERRSERGHREVHEVRSRRGGERRNRRQRYRSDGAGNESKIVMIQQRMARCKRGSNNYRMLRRRKARIQLVQARAWRENLHLWTTGIARRFAHLTIIAPSVKDVTASGRGDAREWGAAVKIKAILNRHVLDQTPAAAIRMLEYKIAERGGTTKVVEDLSSPTLVGQCLVRTRKAIRITRKTSKREKEN